MQTHSLYIKIIIISILFLFLNKKEAMASHAMGLDFTYECLGENEYRFYLNFYQDCSGTLNITQSIPIMYLSSQSCNELIELNLNFNAQPASMDTIFDAVGSVIRIVPNFEVSAICDEVESTCNDGPYQGVEKFVFTADYTLPKACDDWKISYNICCRNEVITNLRIPGLSELYVEALINNTNGICNNSPTFTSLPVPYLCVGQKSFYNHGVFDKDGNDLKFTLINPLSKGGTEIEIRTEGEFSPTNPIRTINNDFQFDQQSGQMEFTPRYKEVDVVTVLVEEFNNDGLLIGSVMRDIQVVILDCDNQQSQLIDVTNANENSSIQIDDNTFEVCPGTTINFVLTASDPDMEDTLNLNTNLSTSIPNANFVTSGINPINGNFSWQPTKEDIGFNSFSVSLIDNICPIPSNQIFGFNIFVLEGVNAGKDKIKCSDKPVVLTAKGGSQFSWRSDTEMYVEYQSPNSDTLIVNPPQTTTYYVESNLGEGCLIIDTVMVKIQNGFDYTISPTLNVCQFEEVAIFVQPNEEEGPYTYQWEPAQAFVQNEVPKPTLIANTSMQYSVKVTNDAGCTISDSVQINVTDRIPDFSLIASKDTVCTGEPVDLNVEIKTCEDCEVGDGNTESIEASPFGLIWEDAKIQMLFLAEELKAAKVPSGFINQLTLTVTNKYSSIDIQNFQIAMAATNANTLNSTLGFISNTQTVFGPTIFTTQMGENSFDLNLPFQWDGNSNIVVEMCFDNDESDAPDEVLATNTNFVSVLKGDTDGANSCNLAGDEELMERPDIRFGKKVENTIHEFDINWVNTASSSPLVTIMPDNSAYYIVEVGSTNCLRKDSIQIFTYPKPEVSLGDDVNFYGGETVQLTAEGNFTNFEWLTVEGLSDISISNPTYLLNQSTQIILQVNNNQNCFNTDTLLINFEGCRAIEVPSAFSPNGDGINDVLQAIQLDDQTVFQRFIVYNRYGQKVFQTNNLANFWDGTFHNKKQEIGVFSYLLTYTCENEPELKFGTVTLLR